MISYEPFWKKIKSMKISTYELIRYYKISPSAITRLRNNLCVTTETICKLCSILNCEVSDIMVYIPVDKA